MGAVDLEHIARTLGNGHAKKTARGWRTKCPVHDDHEPSLDIDPGNKQPLLLNCRSRGCSQASLVAALKLRGLWPADRAERRRQERAERKAAPKPEAKRRLVRTLRYEVKTLTGVVVAVHIRREYDDGSKDMPWEKGLKGKPVAELPLFGTEKLCGLAPGSRVVITEGEKAAVALERGGIVALGTVTGAGENKAIPVDSVLEVLKCFDVRLWPDNDDVGRAHMDAIAARLCAMGVEPRLVHWKDTPAAGDAADFEGDDLALGALIDAAIPYPTETLEPAKDGDAQFCVSAATVKEEPVQWIYPRILARRELHEWIGDPETMKTTAVLDMVARITTGRGFPDNEPRITPGNAIILSFEDREQSTLRPRLRVAGADLEKVYFMRSMFIDEEGDRVPLLFPDHIPRIEDEIVATRAAALVIDPLDSGLNDKTNSHNNASVRKVLAELRAMAERTGCAIVSIRHMNKMGAVEQAMYRGGGSIGFTGASRVSFMIGRDPTQEGVQADDPQRRRVIATIKNNLGPWAPSRAFRKAVDPQTIDANHPDGIVHIEWMADPVPVTANDLCRMQHKRRNPQALQEAMDFLRDELREDAKPSDEVEKRAHALGISSPTLKRARKKMGVKSYQKGFGGEWMIHIPANDD